MILCLYDLKPSLTPPKEHIIMKTSIIALAFAAVLALAPAAQAASENPFELNNATVEELMERCFFPEELATQIIELRDSLGGFQSWDDLKELNIDPGFMSMLASEATISGITTDCNC